LQENGDVKFAAIADFQKIDPTTVAALLQSLPDPTGHLQSRHGDRCWIADQFLNRDPLWNFIMES
jgi:hypothetical protein